MEYKSILMEVKEINKTKGIAIIRHAVYDNIDLTGDISRKGMFDKSWSEKKMADGFDIDAYLNHDPNQAWGRVIGVKEDSQGALTEIKAGSHTMGEDVLKMMDEGIARRASFGFVTIKAGRIKSNRELKEVAHLETSPLTKIAANPKAGVLYSGKSYDGLTIDIKSLSPNEQTFLKSMIDDKHTQLQKMVTFSGTLQPESDLYTSMQYMIGQHSDQLASMKSNLKYNSKSVNITNEQKAHLDAMKAFVRNSNASDAAIIAIEAEIKSFEDSCLIDTADTRLIIEPSVSDGKGELKELAEQLSLLSFKHF